MSSNDYKLVKASLLHADRALAIFKIGLSPTSLYSIAEHLAKHVSAMLAAGPDSMDFIPIVIGLMLKLTCDKEVQALLKAEEAANAAEED